MKSLIYLAFIGALLSSCFFLVWSMPSSSSGSVIAQLSSWGTIGRPALEGLSVIWVPDNYSTIQAAINGASDGDTIYVRSGKYLENVKVNKTVELIGLGFPEVWGYKRVFPGDWGYPTLSVEKENVTISGFVIAHLAPTTYDPGIALGIGGTVSNNIVRHNERGISTGYNNTIENNTIIDNFGTAVGCDGSYNIIRGNIITNNAGGVFLSARSNTVVNNTITNSDVGITLWCNDTYLRGNSMTGNRYGFDFDGGYWVGQYVQDIDMSNLIDGRPIYYWINQHDKSVPSDVGYVALVNCTNITVNGLDLRKNGHGVLIAFTSNSTITNCNMSENEFGLFVWASENNTVTHNNFVNNTFHAGNMDSYYHVPLTMPPNKWDGDYPSGGNYWSDCSASDFFSGHWQNESGSDGINDTVYPVNENNQDNYPLVAPFQSFNVGPWNDTQCEVHVISNSTLSGFQLNQMQKTISFNVTGSNDTMSFCRITIPNVIVQDLWQGNYTILVNNQPVQSRNWTDTQNTYIYFTYPHSEHQIVIIPELQPTTILSTITILTTLAATLKRKRQQRQSPSTKQQPKTIKFPHTNQQQNQKAILSDKGFPTQDKRERRYRKKDNTQRPLTTEVLTGYTDSLGEPFG